jgi:hypothetical protein
MKKKSRRSRKVTVYVQGRHHHHHKKPVHQCAKEKKRQGERENVDETQWMWVKRERGDQAKAESERKRINDSYIRTSEHKRKKSYTITLFLLVVSVILLVRLVRSIETM